MWRSTAIFQRSATRVPRPSTFSAIPRRCYAQGAPEVQSIPPRKRLVVVTVAFLTGASIYFFLPDPRRRQPALDPFTLSPTRFSPTQVISNEDVGPNTKLLKVALHPKLIPSNPAPDFFAPIWSVFIKDDDIQVERPYTPLYGIDEKGHMLFWIKKYPQGEVGRWLHSRKPGATLELRGPTRTWPWDERDWEEVVMISGGTGITPFAQLFNNFISKSGFASGPKFTLIHGSATPGELPPRVILEPMVQFARSNPERFELHLLVDKDDGSTPPTEVSRLRTGRVTESVLNECLGLVKPKRTWSDVLLRRTPEEPKPRKTLYLVCGPEGMIAAVAGPYGRNMSQGPVGGVLANLGCDSDQVYKL